MEQATHSPSDGIYETTADYAHAIELRNPQRIVYLAGTMGLDADGVPGVDINHQLELVWANIGTVLRSAGMTLDNIVRVTSYLRDPAYIDANTQARMQALGGRAIPTTALIAQTLSDSWLVEIEVIAAA